MWNRFVNCTGLTIPAWIINFDIRILIHRLEAVKILHNQRTVGYHLVTSSGRDYSNRQLITITSNCNKPKKNDSKNY